MTDHIDQAKRIQDLLASRRTSAQVKDEDQTEGIDLTEILRDPVLSDLHLTGFEDDMQRRLMVASHLMAKSGHTTLKPLLPLLLQLKGKPYKLDNHFPFEPFFRTRVAKKTLLITGRQVSKSTSLASQGVLFSNCIPYFSTLYVTPLFEMIRRFSQNYVRPFIETSPVVNLFSGSTTINSVLQRSFKNRSQMIFSFAFLDAERTRGISADKNVIDESIFYLSPLVISRNGQKSVQFIVDVRQGDSVLSFDTDGKLRWAKVLHHSYHGYRSCFRITTKTGRSIVATSETGLATNQGWRKISQIIETVAQCSEGSSNKTQSVDADRVNPTTNPDDSGNTVGGRTHETEWGSCDLQQQSRLDSSRVQLDQVPRIKAVCKQSTREKEERWLRRLLESIQDCSSSGLRLVVSPDLQLTQSKSSQPRLANCDRAGRSMADSSMVDSGRRWFVGQVSDTFDTRFPEARSTTIGEVAEEARRVLYGERDLPKEDWLSLVGSSLLDQGHQILTVKGSSIHATNDELQDDPTRTCGSTDLPLVQKAILNRRPRTGEIHRDRQAEQYTQLLRQQGLSGFTPSVSQSAIDAKTGKTRNEKSKSEEALSPEFIGESCPLPRTSSELSSKEPGKGQTTETTLLSEEAKITATTDMDLPALSEARTAWRSRSEDPLLSRLPNESDQRTETVPRTEETKRFSSQELCSLQPEICSQEQRSEVLLERMQSDSSECSTEALQYDDIVSIEYVGEHDVYDIEVEGNKVFLANGIASQNCQDMDVEFLPIIHETMSGSQDWGLIQYAGTPKTLDNTIEQLWSDSSMAEWVVKCPRGGCGHWNIPALEHDLIDMIGPMHDFISEKNPGVVCAKCRKPLNPRPPYQGGTGRWVHRNRDLRWKFAGYHVPQIIMPMHYGNAEKWETLLGKKAGKGNTPLHVFFNEVCGVSYDSGSKMVTVTDLKRAACLPWPNQVDAAKDKVGEYLHVICAVDWGGGGVKNGKSDIMYNSYTSIAVIGLAPNGQFHVLYGFRSLHPFAHVREAQIIMGIMAKFRCTHLVHDYTGAGTVRETVIHQAGLPTDRIIPVAMSGAAKGGIFQLKEATDLHPRTHYRCDKPRSLNMTCQMIKSGILKFYQYDNKGSEDKGLISDFLNLVEEKSNTGSLDLYKIIRDPSGPDDFAQAVNIGVMALCYMTDRWPDLARYERIAINEELMAAVSPANVNDWDDIPS